MISGKVVGRMERLINKEDVVESFVRSSGPGGQNVNKVSTCVVLVHKPTGLRVKCQKHRSQYLNRQEAWTLLQGAFNERYDEQVKKQKEAVAKKRRQNRKRSQGAKEQILAIKKKHQQKKQKRSKVKDWE